MGQGGKITLINYTDADWTLGHTHQYQMNAWSFPAKIKSGQAATMYIEWDQDIFDTVSDDGAEAVYQISGTSCSFTVQARAKEGFKLQIQLNGIWVEGLPPGSVVDLGWVHNGYVSFILGGGAKAWFCSQMNASSWMKNSLEYLGDKYLGDICMPGTHDSGMSVLQSPTAFSSEGNTVTQTHNFAGQLELGARYFDIRPIIGGGQYYTGHYGNLEKKTWQGGRGQSISELVQEVNAFTKGRQELIILWLSHDYDTDLGNDNYQPFTKDQWNGLFEELSKIDALYQAPASLETLTKTTLDEFIAKQSAVLIMVPDNAKINATYQNKGFFHQSMLTVYNQYSNTPELSKMIKDQIGKMQNPDNYFKNNPKKGKDLFLLSWTLTQDAAEAIATSTEGEVARAALFASLVETFFIPVIGELELTAEILLIENNITIKELANKADATIRYSIYKNVKEKTFPNIIYIDNIQNTDAALIATSLNYKFNQ